MILFIYYLFFFTLEPNPTEIMKIIVEYRMYRLFPRLLITLALLFTLTLHSWSQDVIIIDSLKQNLENISNPEEKIELLFSIIDALSGTDNEKALLYARTAMIEADNANNNEDKANLFYVIGGIYKNLSEYNLAIENFHASLDIYKVLGNEREVAKLHSSLADIYKKKGLYQFSLENCLEGLKIYERLKDSAGRADIYNCLGSLYKYQNNNTKSIEYYSKSLDLSSRLNDLSGIALSYNNIGVVYAIMGNSDLALDYYNRAFEKYVETGSKKNQGIILGNQASIYLSQHEYEKALDLINQSLAINYEIGYLSGQASQYQNLGRYYNLIQNSDLAIYNYMKAYEMFKTMGRLEEVKNVTASLSNIYSKGEQFKEAFEYFSLSKKTGDSIFNIEIMKNMTQMENDYIRLEEEEIHRLKDQKRFIINLASFLSLALISLFIALLYFAAKIKTKHQLLKYEQIKLEKKQIEIELEIKNKELAAKTIYLIKKNEIIISIVERLKNAKEKLKEENVPIINAIITDMNSSIDSDIWEDFEIRFLQVHKGFYDNLQVEYPELTTNEKRISAFLRLDMSTKEISFITTQTPHSINIARTRLRKKLGLDNKDINLSVFLSHF